jgi:hypothetical protein
MLIEFRVGNFRSFDQPQTFSLVASSDKRRAENCIPFGKLRLLKSAAVFGANAWVLAHFVRTERSFAGSDAVIEELNKHWRRAFGQDYAKNDEQLFARLADRTRRAIDNARKLRDQDWAASPDVVDCNSATGAYLLVERLLGPSA